MTAPVFENKVDNYDLAGPITLSLNAGTNANRLVIVLAGVYTSGTSTAPTGVTYNGVSMHAGTLIQYAASAQRFKLFWLTGVPTGANNVVVSYSDAVSTVVAVCASYSGVDQSTPVTSETTNTAGSGDVTPTFTISSATGDLVVALAYTVQTGVTFAANSPAVTRINDDIGGTRGMGMEKAGASSVTIAGTMTGNSTWVGAAISIHAVAAAAATIGRGNASR